MVKGVKEACCIVVVVVGLAFCVSIKVVECYH